MSFRLEILSDDPPPLCEVERVTIRHRLNLFNWHLSKTAKSLDLTRTGLRHKMRRFNITQEEQRK